MARQIEAEHEVGKGTSIHDADIEDTESSLLDITNQNWDVVSAVIANMDTRRNGY